MLRARLASGVPLALGITGLLLLDAWLSSLHGSWPVLGVDLAPLVTQGLVSTVVILILTLLATHELTHLANVMGYRPLRLECQFFSAGLVIGPYLSFNLIDYPAIHDEAWGMMWVSLALFYAFWAQAIRRGTQMVVINLATTVFIIVYAGGFAGYMTKLRMEIGGPVGAWTLLFSILVIKMTDTGAYFTGLLIGRHPLAPLISPKKTWEGLAGGFAVALVVSLLVGWGMHAGGALPLPQPAGAALLLLAAHGVLMAAFAVAGDLAESLLKRDAALKDSGSVLPGLGGIMDVFDSPLLAAPAAWFFWTRIAANL